MQPALYNTSTCHLLPSAALFQSTLATCQAAFERKSLMTADTITTSHNPPIMSANGAGQADGEWKPRDMEGEMRALCAGLKTKVDKFLETEASDDLIRDVQKQVRLAKGIIDDALKRYRYAHSRSRS